MVRLKLMDGNEWMEIDGWKLMHRNGWMKMDRWK